MKTIIIQNTIEIISDSVLTRVLKDGFIPKETKEGVKYLIK